MSHGSNTIRRYFRSEGLPPLYTSAPCPRNWFAPNNYSLPGKRALSRYVGPASNCSSGRISDLQLRYAVTAIFPMQTVGASSQVENLFTFFSLLIVLLIGLNFSELTKKNQVDQIADTPKKICLKLYAYKFITFCNITSE